MKLALTIPGIGTINETANPVASNYPQSTTTLGLFITNTGEIALYVGGFLMFIWAAWGVFDYIRAEGNKEALTKARKRIQWAIAGFIILLLAFFLSDFLKQLLIGGFVREIKPLAIP